MVMPSVTKRIAIKVSRKSLRFQYAELRGENTVYGSSNKRSDINRWPLFDALIYELSALYRTIDFIV